MIRVWVLMAAGIALAAPVFAEDSVGDKEPLGNREYANSCAVCHGMKGKGDGPLAKMLVRPPSDLTTIAARNQGQFPLLRVIHVIDGRQNVESHGDRSMPTWGNRYRFEAGGDLADEGTVRGRTLALALYLESIQGK